MPDMQFFGAVITMATHNKRPQHHHHFHVTPSLKTMLSTLTCLLPLWIGINPTAMAQSTGHTATSSANTTPSTETTPSTNTALPSSSQTLSLQGYQATYTVFRDGDEIGQGTRTLEVTPTSRASSDPATKNPTSYTYQLTSRSDLSWWIFSDHREDKSQGKLIVQDSRFQVVPLAYQFSRTGTGSNRAQSLRFLPDQQRLEAIKSYKDEAFNVEWHPDLHDAISYQLQMQLDFAPAPMGQGLTNKTYDLIYKNDEHHYRFKVLGEETLSLPIGDVKTLKLQRVRSPGSSRQTFIWLAEDYHYIVARLQQQKDGEVQADLQLLNYKPSDN